MSDLLNSLNEKPDTKSWADEVAEAVSEAPADAAAAVPEPVSADPASATPDEAEAAPETPQPQEEHDRRVPLKALQEERQKRAEYERQLQEFQRREQEWRQWAEQVQRQQMMGHNGGPQMEQEQFVEPDPETDPIGALKHAREQQRQLQEAIQQQQMAAQQQQYVQQLNQVAYQAATQFQQQAPDYQDAYRYALQSRAQELVALGTPETQVANILQREELSLIDTALRNGRNPAEAIYHFAKARGFNGKPAAQSAPSSDPVLQQAKAAVAPSATSGGAPAARGSMSLADIANLKGAAFDSAWNKHFGGNRNSLFRE